MHSRDGGKDGGKDDGMVGWWDVGVVALLSLPGTRPQDHKTTRPEDPSILLLLIINVDPLKALNSQFSMGTLLNSHRKHYAL